MRQALYGTTALVAAGAAMAAPAAAEQRIKLGLGGFMNMFLGAGDATNDAGVQYEPTNLFHDGEVRFRGETTLDNGITFGVDIQLEAFSDGDQIDESYGYLSGRFGRINLGSENSAAFLMHYAAPGIGVPINSGWVSTFVPTDGVATSPGNDVKSFRTPYQSTYIDNGNDERRVTYFTPRIGGFQLGASYTPAIVGGGDGQNTAALSEIEYHHGISLGVNLVRAFGAVHVAVAGGYRRAEAPEIPAGLDDPELWSAGINVGFAGFTFGGSFATQDDGTQGEDGTSLDAGVTYRAGPWTAGLTYLASENDDVDDTELQAFTAGFEYALGPGITASGTLLYVDVVSKTGDADGVVGVLGLTYNF